MNTCVWVKMLLSWRRTHHSVHAMIPSWHLWLFFIRSSLFFYLFNIGNSWKTVLPYKSINSLSIQIIQAIDSIRKMLILCFSKAFSGGLKSLNQIVSMLVLMKWIIFHQHFDVVSLFGISNDKIAINTRTSYKFLSW